MKQVATYLSIVKLPVICKLLLSMQSLKWIMPKKTAELFTCWNNPDNFVRQKRWWRIIPTCVWWTIGRKRNAWCFEDAGTQQKTKNILYIFLFHFWCKEA
ncbi:hypothetical protein MTR67_053446 [Solanum verrucosum]|uniref:Uncharacterized protein n=1 Tax=Solanum verrucosum TaxID=315347 RepID=A0AAF1A1Y3_SOLVR|nr:hypothetical protein MTR67_053446 [Solanum verrucosum]